MNNKFTYHIWITCMPTDEFAIVYDLMKKGYNVSPSDANGRISISVEHDKYNEKSCVIGLRIGKASHADSGTYSQEVFEDVSQVCSQLKIDYYSLIVSKIEYDARWSSGNIFVEKGPILLGRGIKSLN